MLGLRAVFAFIYFILKGLRYQIASKRFTGGFGRLSEGLLAVPILEV
jgi:hypothetical protein